MSNQIGILIGREPWYWYSNIYLNNILLARGITKLNQINNTQENVYIGIFLANKVLNLPPHSDSLVGWYDPTLIDETNNIWTINITISGNTLEFDTNYNIPYIVGLSNESLTLNNSNIFKADGTQPNYTFCHITSYDKIPGYDIWDGSGAQWLSGFHNTITGIFKQNNFITDFSNNRTNIKYVVWPKLLTYDDHLANAISLGGQLASIHSSAENEAVKAALEYYYANHHLTNAVYIGGQRIDRTDNTNASDGGSTYWEWSDGTPFDYTDWRVK